MATFDAPVCFTRSAPPALFSGRGQLVFYDVVETSTVERSEVLSCIVEAGGEVVLPEAIRLSEFKTWLAATTASSTELGSMPFSSKCTVLKVADTLCDSRIDDWVQLAADDLCQQAAEHQRHADEADEKAAIDFRELSLMSGFLQQRLFATAARQPAQMHALLDFMPAHLHPAVVAATVTPCKMLDAPLHTHSLPFVKALSSMPPEPPFIRSLDIHDGPGTLAPRICRQEPMPDPAWREVTSHLVDALRHHPGIRHFRLDLRCIEAVSVRLLTPAIAALQSLKCLHLYTRIDPQTAQALQQTLQALPHLQDLSLHLVHVFKTSASWEHPHEECSPLTASCSLTGMLAPATQLTSLHLRAHADTNTLLFAATSPLVLPHLSQLAADYGRPEFHTTAGIGLHTSTAAIQLCSSLVAPLTSLDLDLRYPYNMFQSEQAPHVERFFHHLAGFKQLVRLRVTCPEEAHVMDSAYQHTQAAHVPPMLASLRNLTELDVTANVWAVCAALPQLAPGRGTAGLTRLRLMLPDWRYQMSETEQQPDAAFTDILRALPTFPLSSFMLELAENPIDIDDLGLPGMSAIDTRGLSQLTALRVMNWKCLRSTADVSSLERITSLQRLHLIATAMEPDLHSDAVRTLQQLPALTSLAVRCDDFQRGFSRVLATEAAPPPAWPALQELSLDAGKPCEAHIDAAFALADVRPELTYLAFALRRERLARDHPDDLKRMEARAVAAGVTLSLEWDFPF